jgi:mannose-1-phosphate guanylyltransferase
MKVVILAGGPGTRLWPLSNSKRSKAFQAVIRGESMLQYTYRQLSKAIPRQDIYVQAPRELAEAVDEQIPSIDSPHIILNPAPRDTLPITLWVMNELGGDPDEPVLFKCVDQVIPDDKEDAFLASLTESIRRYDQKNPTLTLLCTKYQSFHPGNGYAVADSAKNIITFIEKPNQKTVEALAKDGAVCRNPYMLIASKRAFLDVLGKLDYPWAHTSERLLKAQGKEREQLFLDMELLSISDTIFQTSRDLKMGIIDYDFLDVGTYGALYQLNEKDPRNNVVIGNVILGEDCRNNFIVNQHAAPLVVDATNNSVVVQTSAGGLVISMKHADRIKEIHKEQFS